MVGCLISPWLFVSPSLLVSARCLIFSNSAQLGSNSADDASHRWTEDIDRCDLYVDK